MYVYNMSNIAIPFSQIQTVAAIADNLDELGKSDSAEYLRNELDHQIKLCLVDVMKVQTL